jgi:membrane protease YdiL (CAAX protease family)
MIEDRNERRAVVEQRQDRLELAREAGFGAISGVGVLAGAMTVVGVCAVAFGIAATLVNVIGIDTSAMDDGDWRNLGVIGAAVTVVVLLAATFFGGYVAGRLARRMGAVHGALVCGVGIAVFGIAFGVAHLQDAAVGLVDRIEQLGVPTAGSEWAGIGAVAGAAAVATMIVGGVLGGALGERWHQRLIDRALDPAVGPEADLVRQQRRLERAERRLARKREKAQRRGVLVPSRHTSGEIPAVKWDEAAAATTEPTTEPSTEPAEPARESQSVPF